MFKILSVTGGIPKYLEEIDPKMVAEDNIKNLCFTSGGMLFKEFSNIFRSSFIRRSDMYEKIVRLLATGPKEPKELCGTLKVKPSGRFSEYLYELELEGCQIDYMIQTKQRSLYISEVKFSKNTIGLKVVDEVQQKIDALKGLKGFSYRPVLIYVGGISTEVETSGYFVKTIDFGTLLTT